MAEGKKSFVLYSDLLPTIRKLIEKDRIKQTNNTGELFLHLLEYVCDNNPEPINDTVDLVFEPIKTQLKRDLTKWEDKSPQRVEKARIAGLASAEARRLKNELNPTNELKNELNPTKPTVSVNASVTVNDILLKKETKDILFEKPKRTKKELPEIVINYPLPFSEQFAGAWKNWLEFKKSQFNFVYKTDASIKTALWDLVTKSKDNEENAIKIINHSIANGYKGLFELKNSNNGQQQITTAKSKPTYRNAITNFVNNNQQTEVSNPEGEFFEDTEHTVIE